MMNLSLNFRKTKDPGRDFIVLEYTPIAQFAIGVDHRVKAWNRAFEVLTGVPAEEIIGTDHQWKIFYSRKRPVLADLVV